MNGRLLARVSVAFLLVCAACGGDGGGTTSGGDGSLVQVTLRLDWIVDGSHAPFYAAVDQGFFADEGLDVEILEGGGSGLAATLVGNKNNDFGFADAGVVAQSIGEGVPIVMVMGLYQRNPSVIMSLESAGIAGPQDLVGKTVGGTPGEAPLQLLSVYLESNGVDPNAVEVVNMDPSAKTPALYNGRVDAIVNFSTVVPLVEPDAPEPLSVQFYSDFGVVALSNGIVVPADSLEEQPETVEGFVRAVQSGFEFALAQPDVAAEALAGRFPNTVNPEQARAVLDIALASLYTDRTQDQPIGYMDPDDWEQTLQTLIDVDALSEVQPTEDYYTNQFIS